jgi:hypothetical protein
MMNIKRDSQNIPLTISVDFKSKWTKFSKLIKQSDISMTT